jgi:hypothetical protein
MLNPETKKEILQIGIAPDRIDLLRYVAGARFETAWNKRTRGKYGKVTVNWIDLESLIRIISKIDHPRHREDARVLREVRKRNSLVSEKRKKH